MKTFIIIMLCLILALGVVGAVSIFTDGFTTLSKSSVSNGMDKIQSKLSDISEDIKNFDKQTILDQLSDVRNRLEEIVNEVRNSGSKDDETLGKLNDLQAYVNDLTERVNRIDTDTLMQQLAEISAKVDNLSEQIANQADTQSFTGSGESMVEEGGEF